VRVLRVSHSASVAQWRGRERALASAGVDVTLLTAREWHAGGTRQALEPQPGERVEGVRTFGSHPALFVYDPRALWRALGAPWDVLDIHEEPFALATAEILALRALRRVSTPVVLYTAQNIRKRYPPPFRWLERWALHSASGISACNQDAAGIVVDKGFAGQPRVIPLGVDLEHFRPQEPRRRDADAPATVTVGFVGRFVAEKGIDVLLDAVAQEPALSARLAGSGALLPHIESRIRTEGLGDRVEVVGPVAPDAMPEFYVSVDVVAIPSIATASWTEQFGRVAVEAMACGIPVVSSDAGALPEVVRGAGIVVPASSASELARALLRAAGDERDRLRQAGLERARTCSWQAVADDYISLYRSVLGAEAPGPRDVEVVVVAYGAVDLLADALAPLSGLPVTVVDNSSQAAVAELCAASGFRYIDPGANRGFAAGVNIALADRLRPDADVLLLNPDARIDPAGIAQLQQALRCEPRLASVGPAQVDADGRPARVEWPFPSPARAWLEALGLGRLRSGAHFVVGSVLLLRAEALAAVGGLDEQFFLYAEETDWAFRAHRLGWRHAVVPAVSAVHAGGGTSTDPRRREAHFAASHERYMRKHFGAAGWQITRAACWVGATLRAAVLTGDRRTAARRRAALYRIGPVRVERRFRAGGA